MRLLVFLSLALCDRLICAGQRFAMVEAVLVLALWVQRFDFRRTDATKVVPFETITARPAGGLPMEVCQRTQF